MVKQKKLLGLKIIKGKVVYRHKSEFTMSGSGLNQNLVAISSSKTTEAEHYENE